MKLFQIVQKNFARLGISANQPHYNRQSAKTFSLYCLSAVLGGLFLLFSVNTFLEYTLNVFVCATICGLWVGYMVILFRKQQLFNLIDEFEGYFNERKFEKINTLNSRHNIVAIRYWLNWRLVVGLTFVITNEANFKNRSFSSKVIGKFICVFQNLRIPHKQPIHQRQSWTKQQIVGWKIGVKLENSSLSKWRRHA